MAGGVAEVDGWLTGGVVKVQGRTQGGGRGCSSTPLSVKSLIIHSLFSTRS